WGGKCILEINFDTAPVEYVPKDSFWELFYEDLISIMDISDAMTVAARDDNVLGLVAKIGSPGMGFAEIQEIRNAILEFRKSNKFTIAFAETFGEFGPGNGSYYLASAFEEIYLQPSGDLGLTGVMYENFFLRNLFDNLEVSPEMDHRKEYKSIKNMFTETKYSDAEREMMNALVESQYDQLVNGISSSRNIPPETVAEYIDRGPYDAQQSLDLGLIDGMFYRDEVREYAAKKAGNDVSFKLLHQYLKEIERPNSSGQTIAVIYGIGEVMRGDNSYDILTGNQVMGSDTVTRAFRQAISNKKVKGILFRVNSPGGSYVASDAIWRETVRAKEHGIPIVVCMGDVAASGGYFVSMDANAIIAQPGTITGSIGVSGGKFVTSGFWGKIGIDWDEVHNGMNATIWSSRKEYSETEWQYIQHWLDRIYSDFTMKVANGRNLPIGHIEEIAKGRVWTGQQALALGLVDKLGGYKESIEKLKELAGIPESDSIKLVVYPKAESTFDRLFSHQKSDFASFNSSFIQTLNTFQTVMRSLDLDRHLYPPAVLKSPELDDFK
ncbi:signal peptide peptidase SppA, partial [bacterium]|nr:signal peptide peptidase SppA [candidate division CSSED10-310 bacterium]